jgi:hypothetical protein
MLFCVGVKLSRSHWWKEVGWRRLRIGCIANEKAKHSGPNGVLNLFAIGKFDADLNTFPYFEVTSPKCALSEECLKVPGYRVILWYSFQLKRVERELQSDNCHMKGTQRMVVNRSAKGIIPPGLASPWKMARPLLLLRAGPACRVMKHV